ncbi:MAG: protein kinase [Polyangiales bacterium]
MSGENQRARIVGEKYEIERHLATGGMGELYVARHLLTTQRVALKILDRRLARNDASVERFLREVRLGAKIGHPAVVQVYDAGLHVGPDGPVPYLAMELLDGQNLSERIVRGDVTQAMALDYIASLLEPLAVAHAKGIVHRDLKPENAFLERVSDGSERVRLLDLGIAREADEAGKATLAGQALGTVYYMAPEQSLDARSATPVSDVWSLGAMLYQALAGVFPFDGETVAAVLLKACRDPHTPLSQAAPHVDPRLAALVDRCLSKDVLGRPADAGELLSELAPLLSDPTLRATLDARLVTTWTFHTADPVPREDPFGSTEDANAPAVALRVPTTPPQPATAPEIDFNAAVPSTSTAPLSTPARASRLPWIAAAIALPLCLGAWFALRTPSAARPPPRAPIAASTVPAPAPTLAPLAPVADPTLAPTAAPTPPTATPAVVVVDATPRTTGRTRRGRTAADPTPAQAQPAESTQPAVAQAPVAAPLPEPAFNEPRPAPVVAAPVVAAPVAAAPAPAPRPAPVVAAPAQRPTQPAVTSPDFVTF